MQYGKDRGNEPYMIFVADAADIVRGEMSSHVEKFDRWKHLKCGELLDVEKFTCGEI